MAYFANGSEGEYLEEQCCTCPAGGEKPCPIRLVQLMYNYDQFKKGNETLKDAMNLLIDANGDCQMRPLLIAKENK